MKQLLLVLVIQFCGLNAQSRPWLYYVYAALAATVFEETGRLIAMKFWMKTGIIKRMRLFLLEKEDIF